MNINIVSCLRVFFEDPFWVGVYEREEAGKYQACRIVFGAEPKDYDVYAWYLKNAAHLLLSPPIPVTARPVYAANPKRMQRAAARAVQQTAVGTKAQQALAAQREAGKIVRKVRQKEQREAEKEERFLKKQARKKEKHRGH